jgi:hypothetical protein
MLHPFARRSLWVFATTLAGVLSYADTVTLSPVADTTLFEHDPNNNLGANSTLVAGTTAGNTGSPARSRALLRFDVAGKIPTNAAVTSATVTFRVTMTPSPTRADSMFDLRRMLQSWSEGKKGGNTGSPAAVGDTTWRERFHASTPANATLWTAPGGATNSDFSATVSASTMVRGLGTYTFASTPALVSDVQSWLQDTNSNQGWILMSQAEKSPRTARRIAARESSANNRPSLVVEFSIPSTSNPPQLQSAQRVGDLFTFGFSAEANHAYVVQFSDAVPTSSWQVLTNIPALPQTQQMTVSDGSVTNTAQRFYRVQAQ